MSKGMKIWIGIGVFLVVLGLVIFTVVMMANHWDFSKLSSEELESNTYRVEETFRSISVNTATADLFLVPAQDGVCQVVCSEFQNQKHRVSVQDGTLMIRLEDMRNWYDYIGIFLERPRITVYLPKNVYEALTIKESTGNVEISGDFSFEKIEISSSTGYVQSFASASGEIDIHTATGGIRVENCAVGSLDLSAVTGEVVVTSVSCQGDMTIDISTGRTSLTDVTCENVTSTGSTGDIWLKNVIAANKFHIERSTGRVDFEGCDALEIFLRTSTGSVTGSFLSDKVFTAESSTGSISVPKSAVGGKCEIITSTGDIWVEIK